MAKTKNTTRLYRSESDRIIGGVAGGIAEYFAVDPVLVRIVTALAILSGGGVVLYILLWIFLPTRTNAKLSQEKMVEANAQELSETAKSFGRNARKDGSWGILLIVLGVYFLLQNFHLIPWRLWEQVWKLWPAALVLLGVSILSRK